MLNFENVEIVIKQKINFIAIQHLTKEKHTLPSSVIRDKHLRK